MEYIKNRYTYMRLSIIIPYKNNYELLFRLLDTIPSINGSEVILIDDHSNIPFDELVECSIYTNRLNIRYLKNAEKKHGAGAARNTGLLHAKGEYVLFADSDDWFLEGFERFIENGIANNSDIVFFPPLSSKADGQLSDRHLHYADIVNQFYEDSCRNREIKLRYTFWSPWSKLVKRKLIVDYQIRFDEVAHANDAMFSVKIGYHAGSIGVVTQPIYCINDREDSLTKDSSVAVAKQRTRVWVREFFFLCFHLKPNELKVLGLNYFDIFKNLKSLIWTYIP